RADVPSGTRADPARALGREVHARRDVLHASQVRQPLLSVRLRRAATARHGGRHQPALHLLRSGATAHGNVNAWNKWDLHPSVLIGLVLLGGLYIYLGG